MSFETVGAVLLFSKDPERLCQFYRETCGLPLEEELHPGAARHFGCMIGQVHFAIHDARMNGGKPGVAFSLGTCDLGEVLAQLAAQGVQPLHKTIDMGRGAKRTTMRDLDGNTVSLVQLAPEWIAPT